MNYLEAKSELQKTPPKVSLKHLAVEVVAMIAAADLLLHFFSA